MTELALNILDIVQNSVRAGATSITVEVDESEKKDLLGITISDNGCGIPAGLLENVADPFTTTRKTRRAGLGLPLLKHHANITGGDIRIISEEGRGTTVRASFGKSHIDRQPMGDIPGVLTILISANPDIEFIYTHRTDTGTFGFSTEEAKEVLGIDKFDDYSLLRDIREMIQGNLTAISASA